MALAFCNEQKYIPDGADYDPDSSPSPILICDNYHCWPIGDLLPFPSGLDLTPWTPKSAKDIQLVLCQNMAKQRLAGTGKYCNYISSSVGSFSVQAFQIVDYYDLYRAKTGDKLKSFVVQAKHPVYCPYSISIHQKQIKGDSDRIELFKQLSTYFHLPPIVYRLQCDIGLNLDTGYLTGDTSIQISGEQEGPEWENHDTQKEEMLSGNLSKVIITVDRTYQYPYSSHTYQITGTITVSKTDPKLTYEITATGSGFTTSPLKCTYP